ncbi:O-antigen ligase family protein, partial [bacterium]|nr:O-antigen ligase family protein [bacterium]
TSNGVNWQRGVKFIKTPLNLPLALFLFFALLSTIFSINKGASLSELYKVAAFILLYFLLVNNLREKYHFPVAISTILGVGSIVAGYGVYQYFSHWPNLTEIASTFPPNPNSLAGYLLLIIPLAFALALWSSSKWLSRLAFITASLGFISLLATHSRGGYLAFIGSVVIFILLAGKRILKRKRRLFSLLGILLIITAFLVTIQIILKPQPLAKITQFLTELKPYSSPKVTVQEPSDVSLGEPISTRFFSWQRTSTTIFIIDRLQMWGRTLEIIRDYPFLGTGMGTYGIIFRGHKIPIPLTSQTIARYGMSARFAHNEYLQIAAETGLPSLIIFLWIITLIFRQGLRTLVRVSQLPSEPVDQLKTGQPTNRQTGKPENWQNYLTIGLLSGLTGVLLHSFVDFVLRPPATDILFIYFAALVMFQTKEGDRPTGLRRRRIRLWRKSASRLTGQRANGSTNLTHPTSHIPYSTDSLFYHLYHSPLIRGSLIICLTLFLAGQVTLSLIAFKQYKKGIDYQKNKAFDQAISSYLIAQKLEPTNDRYHKNLGDLYRRLALVSKEEKGFWLEKATEEYEIMVRLSPQDSHYRRDLGVIYWLASQGKNRLLINKSIAQFKESLRIDPTFPFSSCTLGVIYVKMGWRDKAIEKFERAVHYEPNYVKARYNLAILYSKKDLYNRAFSEYEKIIEIEQRNLFSKISCGYEGALLKFDYALAHLQLAGLYEKKGRLKEAKAEYEHLLKIRPDFPPAKEALARLTK